MPLASSAESVPAGERHQQEQLERRATITAAAVLFVAVALPGAFLGSGTTRHLVNTGLLAALLALPVHLRIRRVSDVLAHRYRLAGATLAGTLLWDVLSGLLAGYRAVFSEWPLVYGASLLAFGVLFLLHGVLAAALAQIAARRLVQR